MKKQEDPSKGRTRGLQRRSRNIDSSPYFLGFSLGLRKWKREREKKKKKKERDPLFNELSYLLLYLAPSIPSIYLFNTHKKKALSYSNFRQKVYIRLQFTGESRTHTNTN